MKYSVKIITSFIFFVSFNLYSQVPYVSVIGSSYIQIEYGCITDEDRYDIEMPVFRLTNLATDHIYIFDTESTSVFDGINYEPWPYQFQMVSAGPPPHYKWIEDSSVDTILLNFYGDYANLNLGDSEVLHFGISTWPPPSQGSIQYINVSIVPPSPSLEISGPDLACNNPVTYYLLNMPGSYTTATWTIKQNSVTKAYGNGTTASANNLSEGSAEVAFTLHFECGLKNHTIKKDFWFGKPIINSVSGPSEGCTNTSYTFARDPLTQPLSQGSYTWSINPTNGYIYPFYNSYAAITFYYPHPGYRVIATGENTCGLSSTETSIYIEDCGEYLIYPNPASEYVNITVTKSSDSYDDPKVYSITIIDYYGSLIFTGKKTGSSFSIPVNNFKDGSYFLNINNGEKTKSMQLMIKH